MKSSLFFASCTLFLSVVSCGPDKVFHEDEIVRSFAVISDTHIGNRYGSEAKFTAALQQLSLLAKEGDADGLDAVLVAGDLINTPNPGQISTFKALYEEVLDPVKVPMIYTIGNHDMNPSYRWSDATVSQHRLFHEVLGKEYFLTDRDTVSLRHLEARHCVVEDCHILAVTPVSSSPITYSPETLAWLEATLSEICTRDPQRYVILLTHPLLYGTVYGSLLQDTYTALGDYWSTPALSDILARYPQVVTFGGHLHFPLNDPRSIWQGDFTSVGCASTSYMAVENGGYEEMAGATVMKDAGEFSQGLLVQFDRSGNARITRVDFHNGGIIGKAWEMKAPAGDRSHLARYNHSSLRKANAAPVLSTMQVEGETLSFAAGKDDEFVHHYRIVVEKEGTPVLTKNILADFYKHPQPSNMKESYTVRLGQLPAGAYTVSLVAVDSWEACSEPLRSHFTIQ